MAPHRLLAEFTTSHQFLTEALHVTLGGSDEACWLLHKTPDGAVAVRLWPGLAEIVATVPEALAIVRESVEP